MLGRYVVDITLPNTAIAQYGLHSYTITVDNVRNRESFELTDSFEMELESGGAIIEGVYSGLSVAMNQTSTFSNVSITMANSTVYQQTVYQQTEYSIAYTLPFALDPLKTYKLAVLFPSEYRVVTCTACVGYGQFVLSSNSGILKLELVQNPYKTTISSPISL